MTLAGQCFRDKRDHTAWKIEKEYEGATSKIPYVTLVRSDGVSGVRHCPVSVLLSEYTEEVS